MERTIIEPKHTCTKRCTFTGRRCNVTGNLHTCTHTCTVSNEENQYVCTITGLISTTLSDHNVPVVTFEAPIKPACNQKKINGWLKEAISAFLLPNDVRSSLRQSAFRRSTVKIKRLMGDLPWSAKKMASVNCKVRRLSMNALNKPVILSNSEEFLGWLAFELSEYLNQFANPLFKCTRSGIGTYAAVMISAMSTGMKDAGNIWIVEKNALIGNHCPSPIDYPKLAPGITTCKAMSTGLFAIKNMALSQNGMARKPSLFRPAPFKVN